MIETIDTNDRYICTLRQCLFCNEKKTFSSSYVHYIYLLFNINILEAKKSFLQNKYKRQHMDVAK